VLFSCYVDKDPYLVFDRGAYENNLKKWTKLECEYDKKTGIPESFSNSLWHTGLYTMGSYKVTITDINVPDEYLENADD